MKKILYTSLICFAFHLTKAQTVYIAETGKKYHTKNCPAVKTSAKEIQLKEAKKKGFEPCTNCGAEKIVMKEEKPIEKKKEIPK